MTEYSFPALSLLWDRAALPAARHEPSRHAQAGRLTLVALTLMMVATCLVRPVRADEERRIEFSRDVRPILSDSCFSCHGPDAGTREADLRLDQRADAVTDRGGYHVILPGEPDQSVLIERIATDDPDVRMPPADHDAALSAEQVAILRQWIRQGAPWQDHWSLRPLERPGQPSVEHPWIANVIDRFVLERLQEEGLQPAPAAEPRTLLRRLYFDLIGLPPGHAQVQAFCGDPSPEAYEEAVDGLLASPHFGERLAMYWLDLVRYADTLGYHGDQERSVSPYRDYVIAAFNDNLPFDRFTIENLAGDLLPNATLSQRVASTYNRLNRASAEGGGQPKEYLARYAADRVRTTGSVWLGSTIGCAECHDHKFDSFTARDFYRFAAFFADIKELGIVPGANHIEQLPVPTGQQQQELSRLDEAIVQGQREWVQRFTQWLNESTHWQRVSRPRPGPRVPLLPAAESTRGSLVLRDLSDAVPLANGDRPEPSWLDLAEALAPQREALAALRAARESLSKSVITTLATSAGPPRVMRVLPRGNWMDDSGDIVQPGVPHFLPQPDVTGRELNRLDLARWIVAPENPLTSRTLVNRLWMLFFGQGLASTEDDLGSQGQSPTHPQLLDTLAVEFIESGWNIKHVVRMIVTSSSYRQSSQADPKLRGRDPFNELLARQARWRLDAELVRDNALSVSGLLVRHLGGPSVKPYQPAGYWDQLNFPKRTYQHDTGESQYRRGLYTHWQRTFLHPSLLAFDAPAREECTAQRDRSSTPLQALVLMNDPTYVEAARRLADRALQQSAPDAPDRLGWLFRQVLQRPPTPREQETLLAFYQRNESVYAEHPDEARHLRQVGLTPADDTVDLVEAAAWTSVARALLNLHETITRY